MDKVRSFGWVLIGTALLCIGAGGAYLAMKRQRIAEGFRDRLQLVLSAATGAEVQVGELSLSLLPRLQLSTSRATVSLPKSALGVRLTRLTIKPDLWQLLRGRLLISDLVLYQPEIVEVELQADRGRPPPAPPNTRSTPDQTTAPSPDSPRGIRLQNVSVREGSIKLPSKNFNLEHVNLIFGLTLTRGELRAERLELSGRVERVGPISLDADWITLNTADGAFDIGTVVASIGDIAFRVRGSANTRTGSGSFNFSLAEFPITAIAGPLLEFNPGAAMVISQSLTAGSASGEMALRLNDFQPTIASKISLKGLVGGFYGIPIRDGSALAEVRSLNSGNYQVSIEKLQALVGAGNDRVAGSAEITVPGGELKATINATALTSASVAPILERASRIVRLSSGNAGLKLDLQGSLSRPSVSAALELRDLSGSYDNKYRLKALRGKVNVSHTGNSTVVATDGLSFSPLDTNATVSMRGSIDLPRLKGTIATRSENLQISTLTDLIPSLPTSFFGASGTASAEARFEIDKAVREIQAQAVLNQVNLPSARPVVSNLSGELSVLRSADGTISIRSPQGLSAKVAETDVSLKGAATIDSYEVLTDGVEVRAFGGISALSGRWPLRGGDAFSGALQSSGLSLAALGDAVLRRDEQSLSGELSQLTGRIRGTTGPNLIDSLQGEVQFNLKKGVLKGINLGQEALKKADKIPFIRGALYDNLPPELQQRLDEEDTIIKLLDGDLLIDGPLLHAKSLTLEGSYYVINGRGEYHLSDGSNFQARIAFSPEVSIALVQKVRELAILQSRSGSLSFPLRILGRAPNLRVLPDLQSLLGKTVDRLIQDQAGRIISDLLEPRQRRQQPMPQP